MGLGFRFGLGYGFILGLGFGRWFRLGLQFIHGGRAKLSIYKAVRNIKGRDNTLYNALRSIYEDSIFVREISQLWPELPLLTNLRCGLWYSPMFHSTCYFKSTDGHTNNYSFNTSRLNLHVALLAAVTASDVVDGMVNCDQESVSVCLPNAEAYLHLPMVMSKLDRFSLSRNLSSAVDFAKLNLSQGKRLLICCSNGEDISICVCLAMLTLFDDKGTSAEFFLFIFIFCYQIYPQCHNRNTK
ncbi:uncharacterized protein LOC111021869 [Momordica charantia]|uniref:Uncharacterized protein LOC111021869 n=1 Tax=Momordica charantia TaxID=3673 RepID=A0A6J1DPE1_MOMCH|nr:uncharacterized protein LOC111021869 [Momordica charantia]